jgi:hypothetical protein
MQSAALPFLFLALGATASACAGTSRSDLFDPGTTATVGVGGTTGGGGNAGSSAAGGGTSGGSTAGNSNTSDSGTSGGILDAGSTTTTGGGTAGGGGNATTGGGGMPDAGSSTEGGGAPPEISHCGSSNGGTLQCSAPEVCCGDYARGEVELSCKPKADGCKRGVEIPCATASDCNNGSVCCGTLQNTRWTSIACSETCDSGQTSPGNFRLQLCDPSEQESECPPERPVCKDSMRLPGFGYCGAQ